MVCTYETIILPVLWRSSQHTTQRAHPAAVDTIGNHDLFCLIHATSNSRKKFGEKKCEPWNNQKQWLKVIVILIVVDVIGWKN